MRRSAKAIEAACDELLADAALTTQFPIDVFQTGSGTRTNMNANEVIATLASRAPGAPVHPNDHVNLGQSSNDVDPDGDPRRAALALHDELAAGARRTRRGDARQGRAVRRT